MKRIKEFFSNIRETHKAATEGVTFLDGPWWLATLGVIYTLCAGVNYVTLGLNIAQNDPSGIAISIAAIIFITALFVFVLYTSWMATRSSGWLSGLHDALVTVPYVRAVQTDVRAVQTDD